MSWFDAAGLANIAKSALKEAQRTIDKALDITDEGINENSIPVDINSDDLYGTWVVSQPTKNEIKKGNGDIAQNSMWGSFTGSFFDHSKEYKKSVSLDGLDDSADLNSQHFNQSKLVVDSMGEFDENVGNKNKENEILVDDKRDRNIITTDNSAETSDVTTEVKGKVKRLNLHFLLQITCMISL